MTAVYRHCKLFVWNGFVEYVHRNTELTFLLFQKWKVDVESSRELSSDLLEANMSSMTTAQMPAFYLSSLSAFLLNVN